ncbi:MAG: hypothetical protein OXH09_17350 [Gammaproteobacteria bacterium]|nr:hypothetical protein [Gammaproteobacteria bacterium]
MTLYYVNRNEQPNHDHEVHEWGCQWIPKGENRIFLGVFDSCDDAVKRARDYYERANGCVHCSPACHTT